MLQSNSNPIEYRQLLSPEPNLEPIQVQFVTESPYSESRNTVDVLDINSVLTLLAFAVVVKMIRN